MVLFGRTAQYVQFTLVKRGFIGSGKRVPPVRCQAITWINDELLFIGPLVTNIGETSITIPRKLFQDIFERMHLKISFSPLFVNEFNSLRWRHNERDGVSNRQAFDCLLNRLLRRRSKKTSTFLVTGICEGNPTVTGGFQKRGKCFHLMTSSCEYAVSSLTFGLGEYIHCCNSLVANIVCTSSTNLVSS